MAKRVSLNAKQIIPLVKTGGFIASYVLYGIAILAAVSAAYARMSTAKSNAEIVQATIETLELQVSSLNLRVVACATDYPDGVHGQFATFPEYPAPPTATYPSNRAPINNVECPGAPTGSKLLSARGALPLVPNGFKPWEYQHTEADGVRLILTPAASGGQAVVRNRLAARLAKSYPVTQNGDDLIISLVQ